MKIDHELKILPMYFQAVWEGVKKFEARKNDRNFKVGDIVLLREWDGEYTGSALVVRITYILEDFEGLVKGYCVFGIERIGE